MEHRQQTTDVAAIEAAFQQAEEALANGQIKGAEILIGAVQQQIVAQRKIPPNPVLDRLVRCYERLIALKRPEADG